MQFTPQQLQGGQRYAFNTRIGNWDEDAKRAEIDMKDYLKKKESGGLLVRAKQKRVNDARQASSMTKKGPHDYGINFGEKIMLVSSETDGYLTSNVYDEIVGKTSRAVAVTTSLDHTPCLRNIFRLERGSLKDGYGDSNAVHYGQDFRIVLDQPNPLFREPGADTSQGLYLYSEPRTALAAAKFSRRQEVVMFAKPDGNTLWQILYPDTRERFDTDSEPVSTEDVCVIRHNHTGSFLSSAKIPYTHIFGVEYETHCHVNYSTNKTHNLVSEKKGEVTGDYVMRRHGVSNMWQIKFDRSPSTDRPTEQAPPAPVPVSDQERKPLTPISTPSRSGDDRYLF